MGREGHDARAATSGTAAPYPYQLRLAPDGGAGFFSTLDDLLRYCQLPPRLPGATGDPARRRHHPRVAIGAPGRPLPARLGRRAPRQCHRARQRRADGGSQRGRRPRARARPGARSSSATQPAVRRWRPRPGCCRPWCRDSGTASTPPVPRLERKLFPPRHDPHGTVSRARSWSATRWCA